MSIIEATIPTIKQTVNARIEIDEKRGASASETTDLDELSFQLGLWLSGLESFLKLRSSTLAEESRNNYDWSKEFNLTHSVLLNCSKLTLDFSHLILRYESAVANFEVIDQTKQSFSKITSKELCELTFALKEWVLLSEGLLRAAPLKFSEWIAWSNSLANRLKRIEVVQKLIENAEKEGEKFLPKILQNLLDNSSISSAWEADLRLVFPRFARSLKWLSIVGKMLKNDEPLKTTLVLFARINEQMNEMTGFINNRLLRFPDQSDALFSSLDAAAYTASIELKKVYTQELKGLAEIRPTPLIYAKIETAYSLLNDSLQLTLVNFAQLIDRNIDPTDIFPNLQTKEQQSLKLRESMWKLLQCVQIAEKTGEKYSLETLHKNLKKFCNDNKYYLFYKDMETVERFVEEILTADKKDLIPLLHRFGAYLETLLGQINMRVVLANHPFEEMQKSSPGMFM